MRFGAGGSGFGIWYLIFGIWNSGFGVYPEGVAGLRGVEHDRRRVPRLLCALRLALGDLGLGNSRLSSRKFPIQL